MDLSASYFMDETAGEGQLVEVETRPQENLSSVEPRECRLDDEGAWRRRSS